MSEDGMVRGAGFERRVRKLAQKKNVTCQFVAGKGKGATAVCTSVMSYHS